MKIIDCTLRDGGNQNNWNFSTKDAKHIVSKLDKSGIDIIEIGYIGGSGSNQSSNTGIFNHLTASIIQNMPKLKQSKYAAMIVASNLEEIDYEDLQKANIEWLRIASYPHDIEKIYKKLTKFKQMGFNISVNLMSASYIEVDLLRGIVGKLNQLNIDLLCIADSFGHFLPEDVTEIFTELSKIAHFDLGFHGHNNLGLAFANVLAAINAGATFVDTSLCSMARGAGNLATEQLGAYAFRKGTTTIDLHELIVIAEFVRTDILEKDLKIGQPELVTGIGNLHYYYYDLLQNFENKEALLTLAVQLGKRKPKKVSTEYIESLLNKNGGKYEEI
ncbi:hypothetical protein ACWOC1_07705 [Enterococcus quebecensis]|nr:hypothetical protein [Enterococcus quebecensis]OJG72782.1 aldolase class II [Enterococcus quebecensis]